MSTATVTELFEDTRNLRRLARALVADGAADDLVQDAMIVASKSPTIPSRPWLHGVMRNLARMRHREAARRRDREQAAELGSAVAAPDEQLHRMRVQRALCDAVLALPELYRDVVVQHHLDGLTLKAIAARQGVPEGTIRWRHKEALDRLRAALDERSGGDRRAWLASLVPLVRRGPAAATITVGALVASTAVIAAAIALVVAVRSPASAPAAANVGPSVPAARSAARSAPMLAGSNAPIAPTLARSAGALRDPKDHGTIPPPPARYELTVIDSEMVSVNLAGGRSALTRPTFVPPATAPAGRAIAGHVVDASGRPLAGAVVVAGERLDIEWSELTASAGATTAADGTFRIEHVVDRDVAIMAVHPSGWSPIGTVASQSDGITITVPSNGSVAGKITYGDTPVAAALSLSPQGVDHVVFALDSGADGRYRIPMLAPGSYKLAAQPSRGFLGGSGKPETALVTVSSSATTVHDFALSEGVLLVVQASAPADRAPTIVDAYMVAGHHTIANVDELKVLFHGLPPDQRDELLFGGRDAAAPIQFHDRAAGPYTVCVELRFADTSDRTFGCQVVDLAAEPDVRELTVVTHAP